MFFGILLFVVAVVISYTLSNMVNDLDSNRVREVSEGSEETLGGSSFYIVVFLFLILVYLAYRVFYVELSPWFKLRKMKKKNDPIEFMEYLSEEIRKSRKDKDKQKALIGKLNHFYSYLGKVEKEKILKIGSVRKYIRN